MDASEIGILVGVISLLLLFIAYVLSEVRSTSKGAADGSSGVSEPEKIQDEVFEEEFSAEAEPEVFEEEEAVAEAEPEVFEEEEAVAEAEPEVFEEEVQEETPGPEDAGTNLSAEALSLKNELGIQDEMSETEKLGIIKLEYKKTGSGGGLSDAGKREKAKERLRFLGELRQKLF